MNETERAVAGRLSEIGFTVYRGGWPDLLAADPEGLPSAVEVKSAADRLSAGQSALLAILRRVMPTYVEHAGDMQPFGRADHRHYVFCAESQSQFEMELEPGPCRPYSGFVRPSYFDHRVGGI